MAQRKKAPEGFRPYYRAEVAGYLQQQPICSFDPTERREMVATVLEVDGQEVSIVAYGAMAERLSKIPSGTPMRLRGECRVHEWKTGDKSQHQRTVLEATSGEEA